MKRFYELIVDLEAAAAHISPLDFVTIFIKWQKKGAFVCTICFYE